MFPVLAVDARLGFIPGLHVCMHVFVCVCACLLIVSFLAPLHVPAHAPTASLANTRAQAMLCTLGNV